VLKYPATRKGWLIQRISKEPIMANIVIKHGDEFATTSQIVAANTDNEHASVIRLVRDYQGHIEQFGTLRFEIAKSGGRPTEIAILNEQQSTFLLTLMRNTEIVVRFKVELVKEFYRLRNDEKLNRQIVGFGKPSVRDHMTAMKESFALLSKIKGVDQNLLATQSLRLVQDGTGIPVHDYYRVALPSPKINEIPELTATLIGKRYGKSGAGMNTELEGLGLIVRNDKNNPVLTEEGAKYGAMVPFTNRGHSDYQPKYFRTIFDLLDGMFQPA
jgi:phage regulator Rha-like protein